MNKIIVLVIVALFAISCNESNETSDNRDKRASLEKPTSLVDKMSYTFGYDISAGVDMLDSSDRRVNYDYLIAGILDGLEDNNPMLTDDERLVLIEELHKIRTKNDKERYNQKMDEVRQLGEKFKELSPKFVEEYKNKDGWIVKESGIIYKVLEEVDGPTPTDNMVVAAHMVGELPNGDIFEDSYTRGRPVEMPIEGLVYGFKEIIMMMSAGDIYEVVIPSELAFGEKGSGSNIPPNSALKVKVELVEIISTLDEYRKNMAPPPGM